MEAAKERSSREKLGMMLLKLLLQEREGVGLRHARLELPSASHRFEPVCCSDSLPSEQRKPHEIALYLPVNLKKLCCTGAFIFCRSLSCEHSRKLHEQTQGLSEGL